MNLLRLVEWSIDNNYNFDNVAIPRLTRVVNEVPANIEVLSFYVDTQSRNAISIEWG